MTARALRLHLRARGGPRFGAGLVLVTVFAWVAAQWLATRPFFDGPAARVPIVALAPLLAALLLARTLAGADESLERVAPVRWRLVRAVHVGAATVLVALLLAATGLHDPAVYGSYALVRNALGCTGLVAGAAVLIGARLAWLPAFAYVVTVYGASPARDGGWENLWGWPLQPSTAGWSWAPALAACAAGAVLYVRWGARN
ncbi:hypothetical protein GCM10010112_12020 [Actinoplanes lobatus]|uniref:Lysylphosphatidylglycerol synthetase-like protein (DUF2156 family) n=1 Tax=Actinoplanes lobatus TaxID=113568 RepID=A0A7W7MFV5_9ACTN|nr:hypothetical protein [Actinoplanes lobatus]MBB4748666.1 lysylphosphatidylglycerol synthetase-like protein (DUF2156 family) [Actinoplanes lobatus]GGN58324.1 hypothetical protein GCM10010112_12020 [Actinoplanes lobatus]GIE37432.1 hypothetical protein Alo02nite_03300 [Actinoplanes lobatus]